MSEEMKSERFALAAEVKDLRDKVKAYERTAEEATKKAVSLDMERVAVAALLDAIGWADLDMPRRTIPNAISKLYAQVQATGAALDANRNVSERARFQVSLEQHATEAVRRENESLRRHIDALQQMLADKKEKKE